MIVPAGSRRRGDAVHRRFRTRPGSDFVASGFALGALDHLVRSTRPTVVLEIGAGIGAITALLADAADAEVPHQVHVAVESEPFCLDQLARNLGPRLERIEVVERARDLPDRLLRIDLVVLDGGSQEDLAPEHQHEWTADDERAEVRAWLPRLAPGGMVFVENRRDRQRSFVEAEATRPFVREHVRPWDGGPGYFLYRFDPTPVVRARARIAGAIRRMWFPRGVRLERRIYVRLHRRPRPPRDTVAPGVGL